MDGFQRQSSDKNNNNYNEEKNDSSKEMEDTEFSQPEHSHFEPGNRPERDFCITEEEKSSTAGETICERRPSTSFHAVNEEKCDMSLEEEKRLSLTKDKDIFMEALELVSKRPRLNSQNISVAPNLNQSALQPGNRELNTDFSVVPGDLGEGTMLSELTSEEHCRSCDISVNIKEPIKSKKDANVVAGPSVIRPQLLGHAKKRKIICNLCHKGFPNEYKYNTHYRIHTGEKPFECDKCNMAFAQKGALDRHYRTHTGEKPFQCDKCKKTFARKDDLDTHYRTHTGEKPFQCDKCKKNFARKATLDNHCRTHTGEKPFECDKCNKTFTRKGTLDNHYRTHTGEKPFQCDKCKKTFAVKITLDIHCRTHTGEKPFQCHKCKKTC